MQRWYNLLTQSSKSEKKNMRKSNIESNLPKRTILIENVAVTYIDKADVSGPIKRGKIMKD